MPNGGGDTGLESIKSIIPLVIALLAVGAVLYLSYLFSRYLASGASKINKSKHIKIIDRVALGQDRLLLIAFIGDKYYLIGSSAQSISILTEIDNKELFDGTDRENSSAGGRFKDALREMISKREKS